MFPSFALTKKSGKIRMFLRNEVRVAGVTRIHSANTFASPICVRCPKGNHISLPISVFFCL